MSAENRLARETSPYLLQHAQNPVDWYPWGEEALERAKREDKPILLSIGYAACHWCHVMERESFEHEATAALMNEGFVCIKVDREERPDLDEIYMQATVAMSGSGGWPMTVFLTPGDQRPFFAGTYFPPEDKYGRPGFPTLLRRIGELWKRDRDTLVAQAADLTEQLTRQAAVAAPGSVGEEAIEGAVSQLARSYDAEHGGFGGAPKFPPTMSLALLLRHHRRTGSEASLAMVRGTLDGMARGGMRDHLGGGFARYSTDERWLVPHFEKMLYDNALLARVYAQAFQVTGHAGDAQVVRELCDYVLREMTSAEGMFYSATDADSEGVEGKFFVWTPDEVEAVLPVDQARAFCAHYDVTPQGNWEGHSILHTPRDAGETAAELGLEVAALEALLAPAKAKMLAARSERVPPLTDDKILTGWNALMIGSLAECGRIFAEPRWREAAARAADALLATMRRPDGGLFRTSRAGKTHLDGYLEDYAFLSDALVDLYEAGAGLRFLDAARELAIRMIDDFASDEGSFFATAHGHEALIVRMREGQDGAIPSANAVAAMALTRLSWHFGDEALRERAIAAIRAHGKLIERAPRAFATSLVVADMLLEGPIECVLAGDPERAGPLADALGRAYLPSRVIVWAGAETRAPGELVAGKGPIDGRAALYVCRDFTCKRPVTEPSEVEAALADTRIGAKRARGLGKRLAGRATAAATAAYAKKSSLDSSAYAQLGDLTVGRIGFGAYRVDEGEPVFREALEKALLAGMNLVDTSTNYADGGSEKLVGATVAELVAEGKLAREEIVVVSKIGYLQGDNLARAQARAEPYPEIVEYAEGLWHCLHPAFLADQLDRSLDRLGFEHLDVLLLHNPEYFLGDAEKRGGVDDAVRERFYERIERAFAYLERQVKEGRIGAYGVSSNTVAEPASMPEATDLDRFWRAAERAGGASHHFRVLQLPLNLRESQAALGDEPLVQRAAALGLAVLVNRPLNAIDGTGLLRLANPPPSEPPPRSYREQVAALRRAEAALVASLGDRMPPRAPSLRELFDWGRQLEPLEGRLSSLDQLEQIAQAQLLPHVGQAIAIAERSLPAEHQRAWASWRDDYLRELEQTLLALRHQIIERLGARLEMVTAAIDPVLPLARQAEPLQRKALWTLSSTPGVAVVLLGMRQPAYVEDALAVLTWPRLGDAARVYRALELDGRRNPG
jgi:uncharacterized protein